MDPLTYFPSDICDSILSYLTGSEMLDASMVSKTWYSIIGESSKAMQKVKLKLYWLGRPCKMTHEMTNLLMNSTRRYQNVMIKDQSFSMASFRSIMEQECRNWKKVQLEHLTFKTAAHLVKVLKICQNTVEELELNSLRIHNGFGIEALYFSKLKKLKLTNNEYCNCTISEMFVNCKNLKNLHITYNDFTGESLKPMKTILKNNRNLKHLEMTSQKVSSVFSEEISYDFKLDTFIACRHNFLPSDTNYKNIVTQHFNSLKTFKVDQIACPDTIELIFKMPKLKCLNIGKIDTTAMFLSKLSINKSIEELGYYDSGNDFNFMKRLVDAVPNLKIVELYSLSQNMAKYISSSLNELEALKLFTLDATNLSSRNLFANLRLLQTNLLISTFVENISSISFDECNLLMKLTKKSRKKLR